ncbi:MAG: hypothetical protein IPL48_07475 [Bacteroidetes bacterium]|nr:hypothetical protein [Bacteroidota bacterium]
MKEYRYIQFPISYIRKLFLTKKDSLDEIIMYGLCHYASRLNITIDNVAKNLIYHFYKGTLPDNLNNIVDFITWEYLSPDNDYKGFNNEGEFEPESSAVAEVIHNLEINSEFHKETLNFNRCILTLKFFTISWNINTFTHMLRNFIIPENTPIPMVNFHVLEEFRNNDKTTEQLLEFALFLAINSIKGEKKIVKTNKLHILARAFGYGSISEVPSYILESELFKKYSNRYHFGILLNSLELTWHVKTYSRKMRGFYVSIGNKVTYDELIEFAEIQKKKYNENRIKEIKKEAFLRVKNKIKDFNDLLPF